MLDLKKKKISIVWEDKLPACPTDSERSCVSINEFMQQLVKPPRVSALSPVETKGDCSPWVPVGLDDPMDLLHTHTHTLS